MPPKVITGAELGPQIYIGTEILPSHSLFHAVIASTNGGVPKPPHDQGFWTSSPIENGVSAWCDWCSAEGYGCGDWNIWELLPAPDVRIIEINTYEDLQHLHLIYGKSERYGFGYTRYWLDYGAMAEHGNFMGVHLTEEGQWATRLTEPYNLYGWDCESTLWLRWPFVKVEHKGLITIEARSYVD